MRRIALVVTTMVVFVLMLTARPTTARAQSSEESDDGLGAGERWEARRVDRGFELSAERLKAIEQDVYGGSAGVRYTFFDSFLRGATLGLSEVIERHFEDGRTTSSKAREINPRAAMAGTVLGALVLVLVVGLWLREKWIERAQRANWQRISQGHEAEKPDGIVGYVSTKDGRELALVRRKGKVGFVEVRYHRDGQPMTREEIRAVRTAGDDGSVRTAGDDGSVRVAGHDDSAWLAPRRSTRLRN